MDYQKIYNSIVSNPKTTGYTERHHIVPRCLGGDNHKPNLVSLSYREHFLCHWLLCKIYPNNPKLKAAFAKMLETTKHKTRIISSKHFEAVKRNLKDMRYPWLEQHMKKYGPWNKGKRGLQEAWNKGLSVGPNSKESNEKRSQTLKNRYASHVHHLTGTSPWNKGKKGLQEAWNKGLTPTKTPCPHCGLEVSKTNLVRWHGDKCKKK